MTAINIVKERNAVHLFSDTMASSNGASLMDISKCAALPHLSAAIATRGNFRALDLITRLACAGAGTYGELKRLFAEELAAMSRGFYPDPLDAAVWRQPLDIFVVGWHEGAPDAFAIFSHSDHGIPAWQAVDIEGILTPVVDDSLYTKFAAADGRVSIVPEIMRWQRSQNSGVVGGHIQQTTINNEGICSRIIGRISANSS